jgi:hypothetical protein
MLTQAQFSLPTEFMGKRIKRRIPYVLAGDLTCNASAIGIARSFPDGTFYHGVELPFEVTRAKPSIITLDSNGADQADPNIGSTDHLVQLQVKLIGASRDMTAVATRISVLRQQDDQCWQFDAPLVLLQRDGFQVQVTQNIPSGSAAGGIRMELSFLGSLLDLA